MKRPKACLICGKDDCLVNREIEQGCAEDAQNPQQCAVCERRSYIVDPRTGQAIACSSCSRGFRLKLWLKHKDDCRQDVSQFVIAA